MTIRVDEDLAAFVDQAARAEGRSRAEVIGRALRHEVRRRAAVRDAEIYAATADPDLESDAYVEEMRRRAVRVGTELD